MQSKLSWPSDGWLLLPTGYQQNTVKAWKEFAGWGLPTWASDICNTKSLPQVAALPSAWTLEWTHMGQPEFSPWGGAEPAGSSPSSRAHPRSTNPALRCMRENKCRFKLLHLGIVCREEISNLYKSLQNSSKTTRIFSVWQNQPPLKFSDAWNYTLAWHSLIILFQNIKLILTFHSYLCFPWFFSSELILNMLILDILDWNINSLNVFKKTIIKSKCLD